MKGLCLFACVLSLALARAEDKWVFADWKRALDESGKSAGVMYTTWTGRNGCTEGDYRFLEDFR